MSTKLSIIIINYPIINFKVTFFRTGHRIAPKFCTHVRIDTLTLKNVVDPPHPRGVKRA